MQHTIDQSCRSDQQIFPRHYQLMILVTDPRDYEWTDLIHIDLTVEDNLLVWRVGGAWDSGCGHRLTPRYHLSVVDTPPLEVGEWGMEIERTRIE